MFWHPLGGHSPHFPAYNTVHTLLLSLDPDAVDRRLQPWLERFLDQPLGGVSADGKVLRGSKRDALPALHVVSLVAHAGASILAQCQAPDGDAVAALLTLLTEVPLAGRWRRRRPSEWWTVEEVTVVTSKPSSSTTPAQLLAVVRGHWIIEHCVHWPRAVSYHEDRLHGRAIGGRQAGLRNMAINLIRRAWPADFLPDAWSRLSIDPRIALRWLHFSLKN